MRPAEITEIIALDRAHVWHPYAPAHTTNLPVSATAGIHLELADGRRVIDGMSSWWAAIHGHGHPALVAAAMEQIGRMSHVMFGGLTHEPAVTLAGRLVDMTGLPHVFFSDSGSVSVEVAVKMALQYAHGTGHPERTRLLTWRSGYHGDTFAAMSVCDPDGGMHSLWEGTLAEQIFAPAPPTGEPGDYLTRFEMLVDASVAAVIVEPGVQGAGGMRFHDPGLLRGLRDICDRHGILLIVDEIATGFGRTGELFVSTGAGVRPDIMCVGKALTGGFMTLAATLCTAEVAAGIGTLMHGPTFMANPLACAVATASLELIATGEWRSDVARIESGLRAGLAPLRETPGVADVRVRGAIGVVEMEQPVDMEATTQAALAEGVWLRPFGRLIYTMPPYICTDDDVAQICRGIRAAVAA
ncbi:MAG: adenosylmethionine--8-amino-7-oxononanoate transaminase [Corynebacterium humireducens]|jgi:adenosylmethionine-8-amino-7-oxononanoate aminotransferase|uniref:Adenosylmethionine-8-amino-7-oxononanoate aminotransferase n=1 Tax=Corynebacterium humireducens TaxID=1223514 RepID=A0A7X6SV61_9CORY|nr:adenosylmethionine--8-amino-7-oxononanoate transaminase [Corynebacterium humireducens]